MMAMKDTVASTLLPGITCFGAASSHIVRTLKQPCGEVHTTGNKGLLSTAKQPYGKAHTTGNKGLLSTASTNLPGTWISPIEWDPSATAKQSNN